MKRLLYSLFVWSLLHCSPSPPSPPLDTGRDYSEEEVTNFCTLIGDPLLSPNFSFRASYAKSPLLQETIFAEHASVHDMNSDGRDDLFSYLPKGGLELFISCGTQMHALGLEDRISWSSGPIRSTASSIADLNGDGLLDLIAGGLRPLDSRLRGMPVQIFYNQGGFRFKEVILYDSDAQEGSKVSSFLVRDLNLDGRPDIYVAARLSDYPLPDPSTPATGNALFVQNPDGTFSDRRYEDPFSIFEPCGRYQTYSALFVPLHHLKQDLSSPSYYLGIFNDFGENCFYTVRYNQGSLSFTKLTNNPLNHIKDDGYIPPASMGADFLYIGNHGECVEFAISDEFQVNFATLCGENISARFVPLSPFHGSQLVTWGIRYDGENLLLANAPYFTREFLRDIGEHDVREQALRYLERTDSGRPSYRDISHLMGTFFTRPTNYYGVFYGNFTGGPCFDWVLTPKNLPEYFGDEEGVFTDPIALLEGRCPSDQRGGWISLPSSVELVRIDFEDGRQTYHARKLNSGVAGQSSSLIPVSDFTGASSLTQYCPDGSSHSVPLPDGIYKYLNNPCPE